MSSTLSRRNIELLRWFNFLTDFVPYAPIAVLYFAQVSGSFALGLSVFSMVMLSTALLEVPTGIFSDRIGRKQTLVYGAAAKFASILCFAIGGTYFILVVGAILEGLSRSFYSGNNDALLYDTLAETGQLDHFQEYLGKTSAMFQFAAVIAGALGGVMLLLGGNYSLVVQATIIPQALGLLLSTQFIEPKVHTQRSGNVYSHLREAFQNFVKNPRLRALSAAGIWQFAVGETLWEFRAAFIQTVWPTWALGFFRILSNIGAGLSFHYAGALIKRFGELRILVTGTIYGETVNLLAMLLPGVLSPIFMGTGSLFFGASMVAKGGLMHREFTDEQRATMGSLSSFAGSLAYAGFAFLLGSLADRIGAPNALILGTLLGYVPLWFYRIAFRSQAKETTSKETSSVGT